MNKEEFLRDIRPRIIIDSFNDEGFRRADLQFRERVVNVQDMDGWYTPWYYHGDAEVTLSPETAADPTVRAMCLSEVAAKSKQAGRNQDMATRSIPAVLSVVPIATDTNTGRTLILEGNRTLAAMFARRQFRKIQVLEVLGSNLEQVIGSFAIVNH